jgi:hypothetical protein
LVEQRQEPVQEQVQGPVQEQEAQVVVLAVQVNNE